jgi:hypothetical protein
MIVFDLRCADSGTVFECWFKSSEDFDDQLERSLVQCPLCGSSRVAKAPMAPKIPAKSTKEASPLLARIAAAQAKLLKDSEWVGERFAQEARSIHLGESQARAVHGNASAAEAKALIDEGVPVARLPLPVVPPDQVN